MTHIPTYPASLIERLLGWCADNATDDPAGITAIGLAYGCGLNEHQIADIRLDTFGEPVIVGFALARRNDEIQTAHRRTLALGEPEWFAESSTALVVSNPSARPGSLLFPSTSRLQTPRTPDAIRSLVRKTCIKATGHKLSCTGLAMTRLTDASEHGFQLAPFGIGWAESWATRLIEPQRVPRSPRRA